MGRALAERRDKPTVISLSLSLLAPPDKPFLDASASLAATLVSRLVTLMVGV